MPFTTWYLLVGALLVLMALAGSVLKRLPLTSAMFYMAVGLGLGPLGLGMLRVDIIEHAPLLERLTEAAVVISLFTAGLKLRLPLTDRRWRPAVLLASIAMALTVGLVAAIAHYGLGLSLGAAVLLGAVLAPTDPVLASDVQVEHAHDREDVRFALSGEAGLNDGTAFPFVMLGLGLLGVHELGTGGLRWFAIDVLWAIGAGVGVGTLCGALIARLVLYLRKEHSEAVGLDDFLALGLIGLSYGAALLIHSYGFLAVFAAGLALRRVEREHSDQHGGDKNEAPAADAASEPATEPATEEDATHPERAPAVMASAVLAFNEQLERIGEVAMVLILGAMLARVSWTAQPLLWLIPVMLLGVRPAATFLGLLPTSTSLGQRAIIGWFGVRGIGSLYYLAYALTHGLSGDEAATVANITLAIVAASVVVHGISVTPLMARYSRANDV
ncbi:MAG: cation:proton antiporter [Acidobacteriota bacterium]|nr:cation:proton antiporter [Acidobacteriota bacterium]